MPIYNGSTQITNIQVPAYTVYYWSEMSSSEITSAVNSKAITTYTDGTSPYTYTAYKIADTNNYRLITQASYGKEPVIEKKRSTTKTEAFTMLEKNGNTTTVIYCKRSFTIRKSMYILPDLLHYRTFVQITVDEALPMDIRFEFYFQQNAPAQVALPMLPVELKAGQTFAEKDADMVGFGFGVPPAWSASVWISNGIWDNLTLRENSNYYGNVQISNFSAEHSEKHITTLY